MIALDLLPCVISIATIPKILVFPSFDKLLDLYINLILVDPIVDSCHAHVMPFDMILLLPDTLQNLLFGVENGLLFFSLLS